MDIPNLITYELGQVKRILEELGYHYEVIETAPLGSGRYGLAGKARVVRQRVKEGGKVELVFAYERAGEFWGVEMGRA